jgi:hypothetical protein
MVSFHCKSWLLAAAAMALTVGSAQANQVAWVDWTKCEPTNGATCYGTLTTSTKTITVTFNKPQDIAFYQTGSGSTDYWKNKKASNIDYWQNRGGGRDASKSPYTSTLVENVPSSSEMIALQNIGRSTLKFSEPVRDIFFSLISLNGGNTYTFDHDFTILSSGGLNGKSCGYWDKGPTCGTGHKTVRDSESEYQLSTTGEKHGTLRFPGKHEDLSFTTSKYEYWSGFTIGIVTSEEEYIADAKSDGDPHFKTWKNEHFEFHGQCDIVFTRVNNFAKRAGIDLDIHIRTKMVRYWSYIKSAAIRIGDDILEVEGSVAKEDGLEKRHYWTNYEYRGPLTEIGGYPVTISPRNNLYTINLDKDFPGQKIEIKTFKEFVSVKIVGASFESFGTSAGIIGDFKTGKTLGRDGKTVLNDFNDLGLEWQVLPADGKMFHEMTSPQFPELCLVPEDPRGDRARRLAESEITMEAAEAACASLKDPLDKKDCVYDILATQDLDMVGAF